MPRRLSSSAEDRRREDQAVLVQIIRFLQDHAYFEQARSVWCPCFVECPLRSGRREAVIRLVFVADPGRKGSVDVNSNCSYQNRVRILWHPTVAVGRPECVGSPTVCSYRCGSDPNRDRDRGGVEHAARWARNWTGGRNHCATAYFVCTTGLCAEGCPPRRRKHPRVVDRFCWGAGDARGAGLGDIHASEAGKCPKMGQLSEAHITMMAST